MKPMYLNFHKSSYLGGGKPLEIEKWPESWKRINFKGYPRFKKIYLKKEEWGLSKLSLEKAILNRKSQRSGKIIDLEIGDISKLLLGVAITYDEGDPMYNSHRAYPSAGARYPNEIYILILKSHGLQKGLYHYNVRAHALEFMWEIDKTEEVDCFRYQEFINQSSAVLIITAALPRSYVKYAERSYRFALIEAGHMMHNFLLLSQIINRNMCPIGGFNDEKLTKLLDLDPRDEIPLYMGALY